MFSRRCFLPFMRFYSAAAISLAPQQPKLLTIRKANIARFYAKVSIPRTPRVPKEFTHEDAVERTLKAIKAWDRFPQDRLEKLNLDARFQEDLSFDSLDQVEIVMSLEDEFGIEIPDNESENFKTPADVVKYVMNEFSLDDNE